VIFSEDGSSATVKEEKLKDSFYAKCEPNDIERIKPLLSGFFTVFFLCNFNKL
jgi:hypothetical protein